MNIAEVAEASEAVSELWDLYQTGIEMTDFAEAAGEAEETAAAVNEADVAAEGTNPFTQADVDNLTARMNNS
jgi:elongation factor P--beta-lysine ligase